MLLNTSSFNCLSGSCLPSICCEDCYNKSPPHCKTFLDFFYLFLFISFHLGFLPFLSEHYRAFWNFLLFFDENFQKNESFLLDFLCFWSLVYLVRQKKSLFILPLLCYYDKYYVIMINTMLLLWRYYYSPYYMVLYFYWDYFLDYYIRCSPIIV